MFRQKIKANLATQTHRRPNQGAINLLESSADDINGQLTSLLNDANFLYLRTIGVVRRTVSGKIPFSKYQEFKDNELLNFVSRYNLEQKDPEWFSILTNRAVSDHEAAERLGTPLQETNKVISYLRRGNELSYETTTATYDQGNSPERNSAPLAIAEEAALDQISKFVETYGLSPIDFRKLFIEQNQTEVVQRYNLPIDRLELIGKLVKTFLIRDLANRETEPTITPVAPPNIIGTISIHPFSGAVVLELESWAQRAGAYCIQRDSQGSFPETLKSPEMKLLLAQVEALQHFTSTLKRVAETIVKRQEDFLVSGNRTSLAPLPQSWIAKECSIPRSSVCRIIRNKALNTPHGIISLKALCCPVGDVIRLLAGSHPDWNARKISEYLQAVHNAQMTIRNVNYHLSTD